MNLFNNSTFRNKLLKCDLFFIKNILSNQFNSKLICRRQIVRRRRWESRSSGPTTEQSRSHHRQHSSISMSTSQERQPLSQEHAVQGADREHDVEVPTGLVRKSVAAIETNILQSSFNVPASSEQKGSSVIVPEHTEATPLTSEQSVHASVGTIHQDTKVGESETTYVTGAEQITEQPESQTADVTGDEQITEQAESQTTDVTGDEQITEQAESQTTDVTGAEQITEQAESQTTDVTAAEQITEQLQSQTTDVTAAEQDTQVVQTHVSDVSANQQDSDTVLPSESSYIFETSDSQISTQIDEERDTTFREHSASTRDREDQYESLFTSFISEDTSSFQQTDPTTSTPYDTRNVPPSIHDTTVGIDEAITEDDHLAPNISSSIAHQFANNEGVSEESASSSFFSSAYQIITDELPTDSSDVITDKSTLHLDMEEQQNLTLEEEYEQVLSLITNMNDRTLIRRMARLAIRSGVNMQSRQIQESLSALVRTVTSSVPECSVSELPAVSVSASDDVVIAEPNVGNEPDATENISRSEAQRTEEQDNSMASTGTQTVNIPVTTQATVTIRAPGLHPESTLNICTPTFHPTMNAPVMPGSGTQTVSSNSLRPQSER